MLRRRDRRGHHKRKKFAGTHAFWACDYIAVCERCGGEFRKTSVSRRYCGCTPTKLAITLEQSIIVQRFRNICKKYRLNVYDTFRVATKCEPKNFYRLTSLKLQLEISDTRRKLWCKLLERFNNDFENGWYDIDSWYVFEDTRRSEARAVRRTEPMKKTCPQNVSHCPGAFLPGSCPRNWRDCSLSQLWITSSSSLKASPT